MSQHLHSKYSRTLPKITFPSPLCSPTDNSIWLQYTHRVQKIHTNILILLDYMEKDQKELTHSFSQADKDREEFQANKHYCQTGDKTQFFPQLQSSDLDNHT